MPLLTEGEIVARYRANYGLSGAINAQQVVQHRELEADLTRRLLKSTPETRWQVFDDCYTTLYRSLPWLNEARADRLPAKHHAWQRLLPNPSIVFEIGSGEGHLLRYLATLGHRCVATEITAERGQRHVQDVAGLVWRITDGVNLAQFESPETYDLVISSQVIEHFHPDDVQTHFENARKILKSGGEYIFDTPHSGAGPHDLSRVFDLDRPAFMHLREYNFRELGKIAQSAGFKDIRAILFFQSGRLTIGPIKSQVLFPYYCLLDYLLSAIRLAPRRERAVRRILRLALVPSNIWLVARK